MVFDTASIDERRANVGDNRAECDLKFITLLLNCIQRSECHNIHSKYSRLIGVDLIK